MTYAFADPREWLLEITPEIQSQIWQQSQVYATPSSRWCAYINKICLDVFLDWLKTEYFLAASVWYSSPGIPAYWEFFNGTAILLGDKRVVLIPSEAIDNSELEVPQEWVDIPGWTADYYLAAQVKPDGEWVRIWGYTSYTELKSQGYYDPVDRTYCIDAEHLTKDLNAFWITYQFCADQEFKAALPPLPELSKTQAENLQERLGDVSVTFPRLEVPFETWAALLENEQWRQGLYQQRQQRQRSLSSQAQVNLSYWLQHIYDNSWQAIDTIFNSSPSSLAFNFRSSASLNNTSIKRAKVIDLQAEGDQKLALIVGLTPEANQKVNIRVELHPLGNKYLPNDIKLVLLSSEEEIIQEVQARSQDNYVQLKLFEGEVGEHFSVRVILDNYQLTENFVI